jgi:hypothetical protein
MTQEDETIVSERRTHRRIPTDQRCWCETSDITLFGRITNASAKGAFLRTAASLQQGDLARLVWNRPTGEQMVIEAQVVWVSDGVSGAEPGLGLRLLHFETGKDHWQAILQSEHGPADGS